MTFHPCSLTTLGSNLTIIAWTAKKKAVTLVCRGLFKWLWHYQLLRWHTRKRLKTETGKRREEKHSSAHLVRSGSNAPARAAAQAATSGRALSVGPTTSCNCKAATGPSCLRPPAGWRHPSHHPHRRPRQPQNFGLHLPAAVVRRREREQENERSGGLALVPGSWVWFVYVVPSPRGHDDNRGRGGMAFGTPI